MNLGKRLKLARERRDMTQEQLAARSGVSQAVISALETRDSKRTQFASRLAAALGVPVEWLQDGDNEPGWSDSALSNGLADRVIEARESVNMTPAEFARRLQISKSALSQIENGATKSLALKTALGIQAITGFSAEWLVDGSTPSRNGVPYKHRVDRLRALVANAGGPSAFAAQQSRKDADKPIDETYVSQILNGHRSFGEKAARNMEIRAGLPAGYFDDNVEPGPDIRVTVPLISWVQAGAWSDVVDNFAPGQAEEWLPSPRSLSPAAFALRVRGESMKNPHGKPSYDDGDIIYVDPSVQAKHGDRVVVRLDDSTEATFKQLIVEGERRYLKALNPAWPEPIIEINGNATICGVVMGRWVPE